MSGSPAPHCPPLAPAFTPPQHLLTGRVKGGGHRGPLKSGCLSPKLSPTRRWLQFHYQTALLWAKAGPPLLVMQVQCTGEPDDTLQGRHCHPCWETEGTEGAAQSGHGGGGGGRLVAVCLVLAQGLYITQMFTAGPSVGCRVTKAHICLSSLPPLAPCFGLKCSGQYPASLDLMCSLCPAYFSPRTFSKPHFLICKME